MGKRKVFLYGWLFVILAIGAGIFLSGRRGDKEDNKTNSESGESNFEIIAENLEIPWEITFLPDGDMLVTERPGRLRRIRDNKIYIIEGVRHIGEGGLMGLAVHPKFAENNWIYLYLTTDNEGNFINKVIRYRLANDILSDRTVIIDNIPGSSFHDGGRIAFGPDGLLYVTTGDAGNEEAAQGLDSLVGKILRVKDDGSTPEDNPFGNLIYSYGHRNSQGLAWDKEGRLWATEHGRSGALSGLDEINFIEEGKNYGWPAIQGDGSMEGMESPVIHSGTETWAPAGLAYLGGKNSLFFGGLRGESLYQATMIDGKLEIKRHFRRQWGRIRAVVAGPDGFIYISTSNTDGRGKVRQGDDKIIKINPDVF